MNMTCDLFAKNFLCLIICGLMALFGLTGCSQHDYKAEADETVYNIIDQKWQDDFGSKANYRISDVEPSADAVKIDKEIPVSGILTLPQAVAMATAHNRQYQREKEALYIKALDLRLVRHEFETQFFGTPDIKYTRDRNDEAYGIRGNFGFNRLLAGGTRITTNIALAWANVLTGNLRSGLATVLTASIAQPLLRGSNPEIVRENLTQAQRDTLYQVRSFNRFRKTFAVSIVTQYYIVLQKLDILKNAEANYKTLLAVYDRAGKLAYAGRLPNFELDQAEQDKLNAQQLIIAAQKEYEQALDELKLALSLPPDMDFQLDESELENLKTSLLTSPDFSDIDIVKTALALRLDLANSADAADDARRKVLVAADSLRAGLNLTANTQTISHRKADLDTLRFLREDYDVALELDLPLDRVAEQNVYRKALIASNQAERNYQQTIDLVISQVRQAYRNLTEAARRHRVQKVSLELAKKRFKNTLLLLQYGRANTRDVLDAQEDLLDAQNQAAAALIDHTIATLEFYRDTGALQVRQDGMWEY